LTSVSQRSPRRRGWLPVLGSVALAATLTAGCAASSTSPSPASSSRPARNASFGQCLKKHGVTPPAGFGQGGGLGGGGGQGGSRPRARPTGAAASAFRNAMKACGATGFPGGGRPAG
jgi:hypothetical protein